MRNETPMQNWKTVDDQIAAMRSQLGLASAGKPTVNTGMGSYINDPAGFIMALQLERTQMLDRDIMGQQADMQARNELLRKLNDAMAETRSGRPPGKPEAPRHMDPTFAARLRDLGISLPRNVSEASFTQAGWDNVINNIKTVIDQNNNDSQFDTIRLNSLLTKRNQAFELLSNIMSKQQQVMDNLIRKFGN